jgi:hypothetical protein
MRLSEYYTWKGINQDEHAEWLETMVRERERVN